MAQRLVGDGDQAQTRNPLFGRGQRRGELAEIRQGGLAADPDQRQRIGRGVRFHLVMGRIDDGGQDRGSGTVAAKKLGEIFVAGDDVVGESGGGEKFPPGLPALQEADGPAVVHDGVVNVEKKFTGVFAQQARIAGTEHLALKQDGVIG